MRIRARTHILGIAKTNAPRRARGCNTRSLDHFPAMNLTDASVVSQLTFRVQLLPPCSKAILKFSTGDDVCETFISTRASSSLSYL